MAPGSVSQLSFYKRIVAAGGKHSPRDLFRTFCTMAACAVSAGQREEEYLKEISYLERAELDALVEAFALLVKEMEDQTYRDLLGPAWIEFNAGGGNWSGEFYTPSSVSSLLGRLTLPDEMPEDKPLMIAEPACGSCGMILDIVEELAQRKIAPNRIWVEARDVSKLACDMSYVNLSLYGVPATVIRGNTLTMKKTKAWNTVFRPWNPTAEVFDETSKLEAVLSSVAEMSSREISKVDVPGNNGVGRRKKARKAPQDSLF